MDVSAIEVDPSLPTGRTSIRLEAGEPVFDVGRPAAWDSLAGPEVMPDHDVLCFGTLPLRHRRSAGAIERMLAASERPVIVDMNLRPPHFTEWSIEFAVASADVLKLNRGELKKAAEVLGVRESPEALGPPWVCVTRAAEGADLHRSDGTGWSAKALPTRVVDSVGAGDAFLAGLIDGLIRVSDPYAALETAIRLATETLGHRGGLPGSGSNP